MGFREPQGGTPEQEGGSKVTANKVKKGIEEEIARGEWGTEQSDLPTLVVQGQKFIDSPLRDWSPKTLREYLRSFNNHIKPLLGNKPIDKIEIKDVKKMLAVNKGQGSFHIHC